MKEVKLKLLKQHKKKKLYFYQQYVLEHLCCLLGCKISLPRRAEESCLDCRSSRLVLREGHDTECSTHPLLFTGD